MRGAGGGMRPGGGTENLLEVKMTRLSVLGSGLAAVGVLVVMAWLVGSGLATPAMEAAQAEQTKWPPLFPRAGATKVLETDRIIVWDQVYTADEIVHKHIRDILVFAVEDGPIRVSTPDGVPTARAEQVGDVSPEHVGLPRGHRLLQGGHRTALRSPHRSEPAAPIFLRRVQGNGTYRLRGVEYGLSVVEQVHTPSMPLTPGTRLG